MRRRWSLALALATGAAAIGAGAPVAGQQGTPVHAGRAFSVRAEAYPVEPAPGTQDTTIAIRPASTIAAATNPPSDAFARAAAADLGLAEGYFGQQGPDANADTAVEGGTPDEVVDEGGAHLEAHATEAPRAAALAVASASPTDPTAGSARSESIADGTGEALVATADAEVHDMLVGPLRIGYGRFSARAEVDGTPEGAVATGAVHLTDTTVGGVPVTVGADGVRVDESQVPSLIVGPATAAIHELFSQGGYSDVRVVQPETAVAEDGSSARVFGGGVRLLLTSNDPANDYFITGTALGGLAEAFLGADIGVPSPLSATTPLVPPAPVPLVTDVFTPPAAGTPPSTSPRPAVPAGVAAPTPRVDYRDDLVSFTIQRPWSGWPWLVLLIAAPWVAWGVGRRSALVAPRARLRSIADRYVRG